MINRANQLRLWSFERADWYWLLIHIGLLVGVSLSASMSVWLIQFSGKQAECIVPILGGSFTIMGIHATWVVFGPRNWFNRIAICVFPTLATVVAAPVTTVLLFPFATSEWPIFSMALFGQFALVQLPLWGLRYLLGLRLTNSQSTTGTCNHRAQFSIQQMLLGITVVGIAMGIVRVVVSYLLENAALVRTMNFRESQAFGYRLVRS